MSLGEAQIVLRHGQRGVELSKAEKLRAIGAAQAGAGWWEIANVTGLSMSMFKRLMEEDPEFKYLMLSARELSTDLVEKRLFSKAMDGDTVAMIFYLKNRRPWSWRDKHEVSVTGGPTAVRLTWSEGEASQERLAEVIRGGAIESYAEGEVVEDREARSA